MNIKESLSKGFRWLASIQNNDGSWGDSSQTPLITTGLCLLSLELYALENDVSPFDDTYIYKSNVDKAFEYIFSNTKQNSKGVYFQDSHYVNFVTGICLAAICANITPTKIINLENNFLNGKTYKEVAQSIVNYLTWSQSDNGGWAYEKGNLPDNNTSGYVILGLGFAENNFYDFNCTIPLEVKEKVNTWIDYIQNSKGGSGYSNCNSLITILRTGNLIQEMYFYGDDLSSIRLNGAMNYIADNWYEDIDLDNLPGWNGNPADYQAIFTMVMGLYSYNVNTIVTSSNKHINWFNDICETLVSQQKVSGSWPHSQWDSADKTPCPILSTCWALLSLVKFSKYAPVNTKPPKIPFNDYVKICSHETDCINDTCKTIEVQGEVKVFAHKYSNTEADCLPNTKPGQGDDIGFTLIFGNYGELNYIAPIGKPTVQDTLFIKHPANLKLVNLCLPNNFRLFNINDNEVIKEGQLFQGDILYNIHVYKLEDNLWKSDFNLPPHSMFCVSMLFQVEFY